LRALGKKGFLSEIAAANTTLCLTALDNMLNFVDANTDVWVGWTAWAAGTWWQESYLNLLEPYANGQDRPQMPFYLKHMQTYNATSSIGSSTSGATPSTSSTGPVQTSGSSTSSVTGSKATTGTTGTTGKATTGSTGSPASSTSSESLSSSTTSSSGTTGIVQNQEESTASAVVPLVSLIAVCLLSIL
jgi:cobalamin biosynthesis Mg chelatase CobN